MSQNKGDQKFEKGYRTKKRAQLKARRTTQLKIITTVLIAIILVSVLSYFSISKPSSSRKEKAVTEKAVLVGKTDKTGEEPTRTATATTKPKPKPKNDGMTAFGIVIGGKRGSEDSSYHAIVIAEGNEARIISIPGDLIVETASSDYEKLKSVIKSQELSAYLQALENLWNGDIKYYLHISREFGDISPGNLAEAFLKAKSSNLSSEEKLNWNQRLKTAKVLKFYFPTKEISMGAEKFSQPIETEVENLFSKLGLSKSTTPDSKVKVLVLNGNGEPGIGGKVALELLKHGFLIEDIRNLKDSEGRDNFNQAETVVYGGSKYDKEIDRLIDIIENGKKISKSVYGNYIAVVIGKDFKK